MVTIQALQFAYNKKLLYKDCNITFTKGHTYGLLGKNGSGKTTLLGLMSGNLFAKKGTIGALGYNPKERSAMMLSQIFYLPEQFALPKVSMKDYIKMYASFYPSFCTNKFEKYINLFEVYDDGKKLNKLSMGQQKKFLISFGLATNCKLNLLDEPTNALDIPSKKILRKLITDNASKDKTFVISTHQIKDIENLIDYVCIVDEGKVMLNASIESINNSLEMQTKDNLDGSELYTEDIGVNKYEVIQKSTSTNTNTMDIELLFNAIIANNTKIREAL
jgi:ABC-2 type transport system ATP-binding protein